ncbi:hypothetical protein GF361_05905 [Candidatus Woesearchaeota archaeon]|nr:hypothetical protein [Candidatus Woesearchaeota archaeon]
MGAFRMETINIALSIIISLSGIPLGFLLAKIAKEELKKGEQYFIWMQNIILILAVNLFFYTLDLKIASKILILILTSLLIIKTKPRAVIGYIIFAVLFYLDLKNIEITLALSSLMFLYGFPTASLIRLEGINALKIPIHHIKKEIKIIGHRGAPKYRSENTLSSFKKAIKLGADMIEVDARLTKDNKVIIMHDPTVDRTTDGKGYVGNMTLKKIKTLKTKNNENPPTLQETIDLLKNKKTGINVHIKEYKAADKVIDTIKKNNFQKRTIISSLARKTLARTKEREPKIRTALLISKPRIRYINIGKKLDCYALHPMYHTITKRMVVRAHNNGFKVNVWTIKNKLQAIKSKVYYKVDGLITDDPLLYSKK